MLRDCSQQAAAWATLRSSKKRSPSVTSFMLVTSFSPLNQFLAALAMAVVGVVMRGSAGIIYNQFQYQMSVKGSPIRGLQPAVKQFTLQSYALNSENDRLTQLLIAKNAEIQGLVENNARIRQTYEAQAEAYRRNLAALEAQLQLDGQARHEECESIREKYARLTEEETAALRTTHTSEVDFLFSEIAHLRASLETQASKLAVRDHENATLKASYERELASAAGEVNTLGKKLMQAEEERVREVRELSSRRELERSRTTGAVSSRREANQYIEKQLRKLNEEVLEKTVAIENASRELLRERRRLEEAERANLRKVDLLTQDFTAQLAAQQDAFLKAEKILKEELADYRAKEIRLLEENEGLKSANHLQAQELAAREQAVRAKGEEVGALKAAMEKLREEHITEINNLMKERRKRSSKSNLGSSRSLTSSLRESAIIPPAPATPLPAENDTIVNKFPSFLPTVREETSPERKDLSQQLSHSNIVEQEENELARAICHYDSIIEELKHSHEMEIEYLRLSSQQSATKLREKELELEDVLTRFSPLVKIHADEKSLEEDRRERIDRHWKADLAILEIMLSKYRIRTF